MPDTLRMVMQRALLAVKHGWDTVRRSAIADSTVADATLKDDAVDPLYSLASARSLFAGR